MDRLKDTQRSSGDKGKENQDEEGRGCGPEWAEHSHN